MFPNWRSSIRFPTFSVVATLTSCSATEVGDPITTYPRSTISSNVKLPSVDDPVGAFFLSADRAAARATMPSTPARTVASVW